MEEKTTIRPMVIYHGIKADGPKFKPCLHSTSYLKS